MTPDGLKTSEIRVTQYYADARGTPVRAGYTYHCFRPLTAYFSKRTGERERFCTFLTTTPVGDTESIVWLIVAINFGWDMPEAQIHARQDIIFGQDRRIVESQRPERIPLDLHAELHVRSDKLAVEYRKWLKQATLSKRCFAVSDFEVHECQVVISLRLFRFQPGRLFIRTDGFAEAAGKEVRVAQLVIGFG